MVQLDEILAEIPVLDGFPRPDWVVVGDWIRAHRDAEEADELWTDLARQWLEKLERAAGDDYAVFESGSFLLLSSAGERLAANLVQIGEQALATMLEGLPGREVPGAPSERVGGRPWRQRHEGDLRDRAWHSGGAVPRRR